MGKEKCSTPHFPDEELQSFFIWAANKLPASKADIIAVFSGITDEELDTSALEKEQGGILKPN